MGKCGIECAHFTLDYKQVERRRQLDSQGRGVGWGKGNCMFYLVAADDCG